MRERTLIQSHVLRRYFVSTIYRQSSSGIWPCWYYETLVWEWDDKERKRGAMLHVSVGERDPHYRAAALVAHAQVCANLAERHPEFREDDEEETEDKP